MLYSTPTARARTEAHGRAWSIATPQLNPKSQKFCVSILSLSNQAAPLPRQTNAFQKLQLISYVHRAQASEELLREVQLSGAVRASLRLYGAGQPEQSMKMQIKWYLSEAWVTSPSKASKMLLGRHLLCVNRRHGTKSWQGLSKGNSCPLLTQDTSSLL